MPVVLTATTAGESRYASQSDLAGLGGEFTAPSGWSDGDLDIELQRSSRFIDNVTGTHFSSTDLVLTLDGMGTQRLWTRRVTTWPIVSISEIKWRKDISDDFDNADDDVEIVVANDWTIGRSRRYIERIDTETGEAGLDEAYRRTHYAFYGTYSRRRSQPVWARGHRNYRVTGKFGRKTVPTPIVWACVLLTRERLSPGSIARYEEFDSERFSDGYSYTRPGRGMSAQQALQGRTTGYEVVDRLLVPFAERLPSLSAVR